MIDGTTPRNRPPQSRPQEAPHAFPHSPPQVRLTCLVWPACVSRSQRAASAWPSSARRALRARNASKPTPLAASHFGHILAVTVFPLRDAAMARRIPCPDSRAILIVSAAAAERGRMRCPECETVVDVPAEREGASEGEQLRRLTAERAGDSRRPRYDDDDDRPRRKRKRSSGAMVLWIVLGGAALLLLVCGGGIYLMVRSFGSEHSQSPVPLMQARAGFTTNITNPQTITDGPAPPPPPEKFKLVRYPSPAGQLAAYLTPDTKDGQRRPAVVWAHPDFGGIGDNELADEGAPMKFAKAGFVVMCPSWRAENDNPGRFEMFF